MFDTYKNKTVLVTGHTGFKGSWLSIWLNHLGANVIGYALDPQTPNDNFCLSGIGKRIVDIRGDVRDEETLHSVFRDYKPEFIFHLAAQPLVKYSYDNPVETYSSNLMGTVNVLEAMRACSESRAGIFITTDKCYKNKEQIWGYKETDRLGGYDPYSSSKAACEIAINSWRQSYFHPNDFDTHGKVIASTRAGNVIGGGDWAKDRIIPDCIRAIETGNSIMLRNPEAIRPWQHVLEPLSGYLMLGEKLIENPKVFSGPWNFGPETNAIVSVKALVEEVIRRYGNGNIKLTQCQKKVHETNVLSLDISKARFKLGWHPKWDMEQAVKFTIEWYRFYKKQNCHDLAIRQIKLFCS